MIKFIILFLFFTYQITIKTNADTLLIEKVTKNSDISLPSRSMTMDQVVNQFGEPLLKKSAIGNPPITQWHYEKFIVYFEKKWVIQSVILKSNPTLVP